MALLLEQPSSAAIASRGRCDAPTDKGRSWTRTPGGRTLDELLTGVWEGLSAGETVRCPACGGAMGPARETGLRRVAGACRDCAAHLI